MVDLHDLDSFEQGLPVPARLSPAEVRRRGDRLRRRRSAGYVAAGVLSVALAVGVPSVALSNHGGSDDIQPAPRPAQTAPPQGWVRSVGDFPIESGFATPSRRVQDPDPALTPACGQVVLGDAAPSDEAVVSHVGESEDRAQRWLLVYPDQRAAEDAVAQVRTAVGQCVTEPLPASRGQRLVYGEVPADLGTEESFAWTEQVEDVTDGLMSQLTYVQVARTGNAVYVESSYTAAGGDQVVAAEQQRLTRASQPALGSMCEFAVDPCAGG